MNSTNIDTFEFIDIAIIYTGILAFSLSLSFIATGLLVYNPPKDNPVPYDLKYYDEFVELEEIELDNVQIKNLKSMFIKEVTDEGDIVIICYNVDIDSFQIWSNTSLPFSTMDSVAQLFAIINNCKCICIDYKNEIADANERIKTQTIKVKKETNIKNSPFASFKNYNMKATKILSSNNKFFAVPEKCNHFRKSGTIDDWGKTYMGHGHWADIDDESAKVWVCDKSEQKNALKYSYSEWKTKQQTKK